MTDAEAEQKARDKLHFAVDVIENWIIEHGLEYAQEKITAIATDHWRPILLQAAHSIQTKLTRQALANACTGLDPLRCDDPKCPVHGGAK